MAQSPSPAGATRGISGTGSGGIRPDLVLSGLLFATALAGALVLAGTGLRNPDAAQRAILLHDALRVALVAALAGSFAWAPGGVVRAAEHRAARAVAWCAAHPLAALAGLGLALYLLAWLTTPPIAFNAGLGHDGVHYHLMSESFGRAEAVAKAPYVYRPLLPFLVHVSGLGTIQGFQVIDALSYAGCVWLLYRIALHFGASNAGALLAVYAFAALKYTLKFWVYYPVLNDAFGTLLLLAVVHATLQRQLWLYLVAMCAAAVSRENLLPLIPFFLIHALRTESGAGRRTLALASQAIPVAFFWVSREYPVVTPIGQYADRGALGSFWVWTRMFFEAPGRQAIVVTGAISSLGPLLVLGALYAKRVWRFAIERPEWLYYAAANAAMAVVGGEDIDRFAVWQAPLLIAAGCASERARAASPWLLLHLALLHAFWMELPLPWDSSESFYFSRSAPYSLRIPLWPTVTLSTAGLVAALLCVLAHPRARRLSQSS